MNFERYLEKIEGDYRQAVKVEWLNSDESVNFEFTNSLYDIGVDLSVNYQNGSRRSCTLTLNNDKNQFPINFNNIWIGQKFKLWMGIYLDENTPYYFPQGVFYVTNPEDVYNPTTKTIKINGVDKWAFLDGTLHGFLPGTYQTNIDVNLFDATKELLSQPILPIEFNLNNVFEVINDPYYFKYEDGEFRSNNIGQDFTEAKTTLVAREDMDISFEYYCSSERTYDTFTLTLADSNDSNVVEIDKVSGSTDNMVYQGKISKDDKIIFQYKKDRGSHSGRDCAAFFNIKINAKSCVLIDPVTPMFSPYFLNKKTIVPVWDEKSKKYVDTEKEIIKCPYTAVVEKGGTYADILLEYATILCAHIYYDVNGRLTIEPMSDEVDNIVDTNKEIVWNYSVEEKTFLGLTQTYNFNKVYNDIIVLGNIVNGKQFKARVQNRNIMSDTCIQKIGLKTKEPFEDNQYYSDKQCEELAIYYAKVDTILQKSGDIDSLPLYHIDVNKIVTVSTPNNNMNRELFLITGFTINSLKTMSINVTSVNDLNNFSVVGGL